MSGRYLLLTLLAPAVLVGCGGSTGATPGGALTPQEKAARLALVKANNKLNDLEMVHLCPMLYPADLQKAILVDSTGKSAASKDAKKTLDKYRFSTQKVRVKQFTAEQLASAKAARCGNPIPITQPASEPKK